MKVHFLGTLGWFDTRLGNTLCVLVDTGREYVIFDAGGGFYKIDDYIRDSRPIYLFLSHFHLDHIIGLHALNKFNFSQGIRVFGPKGIKEMFGLIINAPYSKSVRELRTRIKVASLKRNLKFPFNIEYRKLTHRTLCYGYRLSAMGKTIAFCTDTGPCRQVNILAKNADLLIAESALPAGATDREWPHLNPAQAARIAKAAKVKKLILVHFDAAAYPKQSDIRTAEKTARRIFKNSLAAGDGLDLKI